MLFRSRKETYVVLPLLCVVRGPGFAEETGRGRRQLSWNRQRCYSVRFVIASKTVDLKSRLIQAPPRDLSGPLASDRFTYQQTWALCHLLGLHQSGNDYVVIFDHHEDVSTLDSEEQPTILIGYQIKTKDPGRYTIPALLKQEKGAGNPPSPLPSILGKLFDLKVRFPTEVKLVAIVSNASVSVRLKSDGKVHYDQELTTF